jgi:hypothetical protein
MRRVLIVAIVTGVIGGVVVGGPAIAADKHGPTLCLMDAEC